MLSKSMEKALNKQINKELTAAYHYLAMAAYFETQSLGGFAKWMQRQANEEVEHGMKLYAHINDRGGSVTLDALPKPSSSFSGVKDVFTKALKMEKANTKAINELYELALKESDYPVQNMLQWFIDEQVEEEDTMNTLIDQLELAGDSGAAILMLNGRMYSND